MPQFFTPSFKQRIRVAAAVVTMLTGAAPFVAGLLLMQVLGDKPHGVLPAAVAVVSFLLGGGLPWLAQNVMGLAGNAGLRRRLREHVLAQGGGDLSAAVFVGFSPGESLHIWQGETDRDIGFLTLGPQALTYYGDDFSWVLPAELVDHIDLTPVEAGLQRILIRWHVPREASRTFSLESREASSVSRARLATNALYRRLREWARRAASDGPAEPGQEAGGSSSLPSLGLPPTDMTGAQIIEDPPSGSCVSILALGSIIVIAIWRVSGAFFAYGQYYQAMLWAGLISVLGALAVGYLLHYLQAWEAQQRQQRR